MSGFVQIIEFTTSRIDEVQDLAQERRHHLNGSVVRGTITADLDRPGTYFNIMEFESAESAIETANVPEAGEFALKMAELCDGPPKTYNLDPLETWQA